MEPEVTAALNRIKAIAGAELDAAIIESELVLLHCLLDSQRKAVAGAALTIRRLANELEATL